MFGVFDRFGYLHRSLLWRRAGDVPLRQIGGVGAPTWSWTAFEGAIDYLDISPLEVEWNTNISFNTSTAQAPVLMAPVMEFEINEMLHDQSLLVLDVQRAANVRNIRCVMVGKQERSSGGEEDLVCYVLVVSPMQSTKTPQTPQTPQTTQTTQTTQTELKFERLGVATIRKAHIAIERGSVEGRLI